MENHQWLIDLLLTVAADADEKGLENVSQKAARAATVAIGEVPRLPLSTEFARLAARSWSQDAPG